nr:hypothetical protein CFP56_04050 [Quercus suber]
MTPSVFNVLQGSRSVALDLRRVGQVRKPRLPKSSGKGDVGNGDSYVKGQDRHMDPLEPDLRRHLGS